MSPPLSCHRRQGRCDVYCLCHFESWHAVIGGQWFVEGMLALLMEFGGVFVCVLVCVLVCVS